MNSNSKPTYILGISCFYHDAAAALLRDGEIVAAAHEERFTRKKHDESFPQHAIAYCLQEAQIAIDDVAYIAFYDKPFLKFERILESFIQTWPFGYGQFLNAIPQWLKEKISIKSRIARLLNYKGPIYFAEHHVAHAASAFYASPFEKAALLTVDGIGEWATTSWGIGDTSSIIMRQEIRYPHSWGLLYSIVTHFLGFKTNSAEYKVMGLAPYGTPHYTAALRSLITTYADGSFKLHPSLTRYFFVMMFIERTLQKILGFPRREAESALEQHHKDLAASIQELTNERMVALATYVRAQSGCDALCLAGGVALNCVANYHILKEAGFDRVYIQPAAGDAGGALGAAWWVHHEVLKQPRVKPMAHSYWGPAYTNESVSELFHKQKIPFTTYDTEELLRKTAQYIDEGHVVGWFQGRMEWGPRALGNRSIIADARNAENWKRVNVKIKFRESFRPFAPSVLYDHSRDYFEFPTQSPYMLFIAPVIVDTIPAVTHVDYTARLQTVTRTDNALYYALIEAFYKHTGCAVIINTSFNVRGEPIVCSPEDALRTFLETDMDTLVIGNHVVEKKLCPHLVASAAAREQKQKIAATLD